MFFCAQGKHVIVEEAEAVTRNGKRYCPEHLPVVPLTVDDLDRLLFAEHRRHRGDFDDDDHGEGLTDAQKARLGR